MRTDIDELTEQREERRVSLDDDGRGALRPASLYRTVLLAGGLVVAVLLFRQLVTLVVAVLVTVIVAIPAEATATRLERFRIPRFIGALVGLLLLAGVFVGVGVLVIPSVVDEASAFIDNLPQTADTSVEQIASLLGVQPARVGEELQAYVQGLIDNPQSLISPIAAFGLELVALLFGIIFVLVTAYYMAVRPQPLVNGVLRLFLPERRDHVAHILSRLRAAYIGWLQGVGIDMVVTGVLLYAGLALLDIEYALLFAAFSAVLVVVPYFGAFVGGIPPVMFALTDSPEKALLVFIVYLIVQQIEGNLIVPLVMAQRVKLHPAVIAVGVVVVAQLFGLIGLLVSVPLISTAVILTHELWVTPREHRALKQLALPGAPEPDAPESASDRDPAMEQRRARALRERA